jgi:hypothetical protein
LVLLAMRSRVLL